MTAWLDNERLSAYLDGELSPQERQIVEKLLASDSAARQLVEELRAQRELIRQLPRFPIPRDLSRSVIALAEERRAKRQGSGQAERTPVVPSAESSDRSPVRFLKRLIRPRNLGWALVAASIGIAIALISPQLERRGDQVEVARRDNVQKDLAAEKQREPGVGEFRAAPSGRLRGMPESPSRESIGRPRMAGPAESAPEADATVIARGTVQADREQAPAEEAPQVIIERMVPMLGYQSAAREMGGMSPVDSRVAPYEIVCEVTEKASLQTLVGRVIRKHQAIPEEAALDAAWEFAANREDHREQQGTGGGGDRQDARPDVQVAFRESEEFEEAVIEFSATLAQVQGVLAELGAQPGQIRNIMIPQELSGILEEGRYPGSDRIAAKVGRPEGFGTAGARALPSMPKAAAPSPPLAAGAASQAKPVDEGQAAIGEVRRQEAGAAMSMRRSVTAAAPSPPDLYRIRVVLRHKRASETNPSPATVPQTQGLGGAVRESPSPQK